MRIAVDTNILLRVSEAGPSRPETAAAQAVRQIRRNGGQPCLCFQNLVEYRAVATRPVVSNGLGFSLDVVREQIDRLLQVYALLPDHPDTPALWRALCVRLRYGVSGKQSHDARLAATVLSNDVTTILTLNPGDFRRFSELTVLTPDEALIS